MNPFYKNLALWLVITLMMVMLYNLFIQQHLAETNIPYTEFLGMVENERVADVVIQGQELFVTDINRNRFKIYAPPDNDLISILRKKNVIISAKPPAENPWYMSVLVSWFPMLVLIGVWIFFMRQMQAGGGKALSFGKSRARLLSDQSDRLLCQVQFCNRHKLFYGHEYGWLTYPLPHLHIQSFPSRHQDIPPY